MPQTVIASEAKQSLRLLRHCVPRNDTFLWTFTIIMRLSKDMTEKFAKGFSAMNLRNMRRFYLELPIQIQQTLSVKSQRFQTPSVKSKTLSCNSSI